MSSNRQASKALRYDQLPSSTVADLGRERDQRALGVIEGRDADGLPRLHLRFATPQMANPVQVIDATNWLPFTHLWLPFAEAIVTWGIDKTPRSRYETVRDLSRGWFEFLKSEDKRDSRLRDITTTLVNRFIKWLEQSDSAGRTRWTVGTRQARLKALTAAINQLQATSRWADDLPTALQIRQGAWPGRARVAKPTPVVSNDVLASLYRACVTEVEATMRMVREGARLIECSRAKVPAHPAGRTDYRDLGVCLAAIDAAFPGVIPDQRGIRAVNKYLEKAVLAYHGFAEVPKYFYPQARLLVPFVLLLGLHTLANGDALLDARLDDFEYQEVLGQRRLVWKGFKARAGRRQRRSFAVDESPDNPAELIRFLEDWTARLRAVAPPHLANHLFLFVAKWGEKKHIISFHAGPMKSNISWSHNLAQFLRAHDLAGITLKTLRASGLDLVHDLFVGDLRAVKAAGGQRNPDVIERHYTSDAARQRNAERTGGYMQLRERWRETRGKVDPRAEPPRADLGACTPGWRCLDPFASPILGQVKGRLCCAYGACPVCPLAHVDLGSGYALARILQLQDLIKRAQTSIPAERWLRAWAPRLKAIEGRWLPAFAAAGVMAEAATLELPELPPLE